MDKKSHILGQAPILGLLNYIKLHVILYEVACASLLDCMHQISACITILLGSDSICLFLTFSSPRPNPKSKKHMFLLSTGWVISALRFNLTKTQLGQKSHFEKILN